VAFPSLIYEAFSTSDMTWEKGWREIYIEDALSFVLGDIKRHPSNLQQNYEQSCVKNMRPDVITSFFAVRPVLLLPAEVQRRLLVLLFFLRVSQRAGSLFSSHCHKRIPRWYQYYFD